MGRWAVAPAPFDWKASVLVTVDAGEQLRRFAADGHRFLHPDGQE